MDSRLSKAGIYAALVAFTGLMALPFFWMFVTALKAPAEIIQYPPAWWPREIRWENFLDAWRAAPFGRFYFNSILTATAATALQMVLAVFMAYAFAVIRFPGKSALLLIVIATMMIPDELKLIPNFMLLRKLGWIDTYWALIIPPAAHAFPVLVLYYHFKTLPKSLWEAAKLDGAGHTATLLRVALPLSRPMLIAAALVAFVGRWNDYLWPLVVTNRESMRTLPVGLAYLRDSQEGGIQWNLLMAGSLFVIMPILILYVLGQRHFVEGITRGAQKG
jgi:ABC-type glycerol-3-phosphate transport system permease component